MNLQFIKIIVLGFGLLSCNISIAQQKQKITIEYAGTGYTDPEIEDGAKIFLRDKNCLHCNYLEFHKAK